jgi:hypothetical protein
MPPTTTTAQVSTTPVPDDNNNRSLSHLPWQTLSDYNPGTKDLETWSEKMKFVGPRAAMKCGGTAWDKLLLLDKTKIKEKTGLEYLANLFDGDWDKTAEEDKYERFEQAIYSTVQKNNETSESFYARLDVWFSKLQAKNLQEGIRLLDAKFLSTHEASDSSRASKVYPANYVGTDDEEAHYTVDVYVMDEEEMMEIFMAEQDQAATFITDFEKQLIDSILVNDDLAHSFIAYKDARDRLAEKKKARGLWLPRKGKGKGKGNFKGKGKFHDKKTLAERIATSTCRICNQVGHWKAECPNKNRNAAAGNVAISGETEEVLDGLPDDCEPFDVHSVNQAGTS